MKSEILRKLPGSLGVLFFVMAFFCSCGQADTYSYGEVLEERPLEEEAEEETAEDAAKEPECIYVQICGAVNTPGVYALPIGARVFEAVEKGGGLREDAAPDAVNQAAEVKDGEMIRIPTVQEAADEKETSEAAEEPEDGRVNINTADAAKLMTLSGIGQAKAESIISYRESNGAFSSIEEIRNVTGIGDKLFQKIKDKIRV